MHKKSSFAKRRKNGMPPSQGSWLEGWRSCGRRGRDATSSHNRCLSGEFQSSYTRQHELTIPNRGLQGSYNSYTKKRGINVPYGDVLVFALACANPFELILTITDCHHHQEWPNHVRLPSPTRHPAAFIFSLVCSLPSSSNHPHPEPNWPDTRVGQ